MALSFELGLPKQIRFLVFTSIEMRLSPLSFIENFQNFLRT